MDFIIQMEPSYDHNEKNALNEYMESGGWLMTTQVLSIVPLCLMELSACQLHL